MKKSLVARGFTGIVASLLGVAAVGCGAATDEQGAEAEIGSTAEALGLSIGTTTGGYEAKFPSYLKIGTNDALIVGGYHSASSGDAITTIKKFTYNSTGTKSATWADILASGTPIALSQKRGEAQIAEIPGFANRYLVVAGRSSENGTRLSSAEIIDLNAATPAVMTVGSLATARVNFKLVPCGNKLAVIGGDDGSGSASTAIEVFTPDPNSDGSLADASFDTMRNAADTSKVITLNQGRAFHEALSMSSTKVIVFGGEDSGTQFKSTEILTVNSSCQLNVGDATKTHPTNSSANDMPLARSKFGAAKVSITIAPTTYEAIAAGGLEGSTAVTTSYVYDDNTDTWSNSSTPSTTHKHVLPSVAVDASGGVAFVGGFQGVASPNHLDITSSADVLSSGLFTATTLTNTRIGAFVAYLGATPAWITGQGMKRTFSNPNYTDTWLQVAE